MLCKTAPRKECKGAEGEQPRDLIRDPSQGRTWKESNAQFKRQQLKQLNQDRKKSTNICPIPLPGITPHRSKSGKRLGKRALLETLMVPPQLAISGFACGTVSTSFVNQRSTEQSDAWRFFGS